MNKNELLKAMEIVRPAIGTPETDQGDCFAFTKEGYIATYNDSISIKHPFDIGFVGACNASNLHKLISKTKRDEITIKEEENYLHIKAGSAKGKMVFDKEITMPIDDISHIEGDWQRVPDNFITGLETCIFSCSKDPDKALLSCIKVCKDGYMVGGCNSRITKYDLSSKFKMDDFLVPSDAAKFLIKFAVTHVAEGLGWLHFKAEDNSIFSCRTYEEEYENWYSQIFDDFYSDAVKTKFPDRIHNILDKAEIFTDSDTKAALIDKDATNSVLIKIIKNKMVFSAEGSSGNFKEVVKIDSEDADGLVFKCNIKYLKDIMGMSQDVVIDLNCMMLKFEEDNWKHIIALVNMK